MRKPWFRKQNQTWYYKDNDSGKQINLGQDKDAAFDAWHKLSSSLPRADAPCAPIFAIFEAYLAWVAANQSPSTLDWKVRYIGPVGRDLGDTSLEELKPFHFTKWLDDQGGMTLGVRRATITAVKAAIGWAVEQGIAKYNPLARFKRPPMGRREQLVDRPVREKIMADTDSRFRAILIALSQTGCRPGEARRVTAEHFDRRIEAWVFPATENKTGKKTGKKRVVYLTPCAHTLSTIMAHFRPTGPLFLNLRGNPWTSNAIRCRFGELRRKHKLPDGTVAYSLRHTFTTEGLVNGVGRQAMQELLGHADGSMLDKHYSHLDQKPQHIKEAVAKATATRSSFAVTAANRPQGA